MFVIKTKLRNKLQSSKNLHLKLKTIIVFVYINALINTNRKQIRRGILIKLKLVIIFFFFQLIM